MRQSYLVTGVPGVGKTTLCRELTRKYGPAYEHRPFGVFILESLAARGLVVSERDLREQVSSLVTPEVLSAAVKALVRALEGETSDDERWALVDSHAVSQAWFGYVAVPDSIDYLRKIKYSAIIHLYADAETILLRSESGVSGRRASVARDIEVHAQILNAVTVFYSGISACPAYFVDSSKSIEEVAVVVDTLLRRGGKECGGPCG